MRHISSTNFWLLLVVVALLTQSGCGYGKIGPKAYEFAKALYSVCNRRDEARLEKIAQMVEEAKTKGELTDKESAWLQDIVDRARDGDWEEASASAREMMEDQVEGD